MLGFLLAVTQVGCQSGEESVFNGGSSQSKPRPELLTGKEGQGFGATAAEAMEVASAKYGIRLKSASGARLCEGEVSLSIMSDFTIKFPGAEARCLSLRIDLAGILASVGTEGAGVSGMESDGKALFVKNLAGAEFLPARPILLGPVVQDTSKYKGYKAVTDHTVTTKEFKTGKTLNAKGSFELEVISEKTTYTNKYLAKPFENVMHWMMKTAGFAGIPPQNGLLFKNIEWFFNTRPIMIPQINITGDLASFLQEEEGGGVGAIVGDIEISLVVMEYKAD
jgi:hypothetical protein